MASATHYVFVALAALALVACGSDGTTASCLAAGEDMPRYRVSDLDDGGQHPETELNDRIQASRTELIAKGCLTEARNPEIPDAGSD